MIRLAMVQRPQHANPREHRQSARRRDQDQGLHCCLPLRGLVLCLRKLGDVGAGVLERDEVATARQWYRIVLRLAQLLDLRRVASGQNCQEAWCHDPSERTLQR